MSSLSCTKQILVDVLLFAALCVPVFVIHSLGSPIERGFWCNDESISYPYKPDTIRDSILLIISFGTPFAMMLLTEAIRAAASERSPSKFKGQLLSLIKAYGVFLFGFATTCIFTDTLKFSIGRLRPHFLDVCKPNFDKINCTVDGQYRYVTQYECTATDEKLMRDSRMSFPSGHASIAVYSSIYLIFYLQLRLEVTFSFLLRPLIQLILLLTAFWCCVTRLFDHKHFASDVVAGAVLGSFLAWLSFYKIGKIVIPERTPASPRNGAKPSTRVLNRAISIESEPQTPTPLLRPERLIISHNGYRNGSASKEDFVDKV